MGGGGLAKCQFKVGINYGINYGVLFFEVFHIKWNNEITKWIVRYTQLLCK